jgi:hypothetical protein
MDFKVAGTTKGITGFQLDLKINGLPFEIAKTAIFQARDARIEILKVMLGSLPAPRAGLSQYAPRIQTIQIDPEKIGLLIGPGGKTIRRITETTGAQIDIADDDSGKIFVYSNNGEAMNRALAEIDGRETHIDDPAQITAEALENPNSHCGATLARFCAILGAVAGDIALTTGARGGVYIAGGIAPRILPFLKASPFRERFERKGRFQDYMAAIPTHVILHKHAALLGAARVAFAAEG